MSAPRYILISFKNETWCPACGVTLVVGPDDYFPKPGPVAEADDRYNNAVAEAWSTAWSRGLKAGIDVLLEWLE